MENLEAGSHFWLSRTHKWNPEVAIPSRKHFPSVEDYLSLRKWTPEADRYNFQNPILGLGMSLESWKSFFEVGGLILLFLTFVFGAGALITASRLNTIQAKQLSELRLRAAEATDRATKNEQEAARLAKEAEDERIARLELEARVGWRRLGPSAQSEIAAHLGAFAGEPALVAYDLNNLEASFFASDIVVTLHAAKWEVAERLGVLGQPEGLSPLEPDGRVATGVLVWCTADERSRRAASALVEQLVSHGFDAVISPDKSILLGANPSPTRVVVSVEHKPDGPQGEYKLRAQEKLSH